MPLWQSRSWIWGSLWCPNPAALAAPAPGRDQQEWAGTFPDTGKGDGSQCCQQSPLERLDLPKSLCPLLQGAKQSFAQEVSWIRSIERFLKPLTLSWAFPAGSPWMLAVSCAQGWLWGYPSRIQAQLCGTREQPQFPPGREAPRGVPGQVPLSQLWERPAGLCWGCGCAGAASAVQLPSIQPPGMCPQHTKICSVEKPLAACRSILLEQ